MEYNSLPAVNAILDCALDQDRIATNIAVKWSPGGVKKWRNCDKLRSLIRILPMLPTSTATSINTPTSAARL